MSYLDDVGVRKEFFLRLDQRFDKIGHDGAPYSVHKLVNRDGLKPCSIGIVVMYPSTRRIVSW